MGPTGIGIGLRAPLLGDLLHRAPSCVRWVEVSPENHIGRGGFFEHMLDAAAARWPLVTHGLSLGVGDPDPLDRAWMRTLRAFLERTRTPWHSDHLCFGSVDGAALHDLLPIPFTTAVAARVADRVRAIEDLLGLPFAVENISWYAHPGAREMTEAQFLGEVLDRCDARVVLDVNNAYVNARNHGGDPRELLAAVPPERVVQLHVAGHLLRSDGLRIDTHGEAVCDDVYELLRWTLRRTGPVPVLLERDQNFPEFDALAEELLRLDAIYQEATA
jgi:uncharacterized protein (UPF0276 family)